ncbi:MAG: ATPase with chaperone activity [Rhizobacter sp.]
MSDESQIEVPPSFITLYVPPGRIKPIASAEHIRQRYELCEDLATMFVDTAQTKLWELGISESDVLERIHAGLLAGAGGLQANEAQWVMCRLAELLGWDDVALPVFGSAPDPE